MELRHCRYFLAVIEAGTITKAAAELGISQPSLSQQIRQFEEFLGVKLFDRGRRTQLTAAGEVLVPHARHLVEVAENALHEVTGGLSLDGGKLSVAFIPSLEHLVSSAVSEFTQKYPRIGLVLHQQMSRSIDQLLLNGRINLGLAAQRVSPPEITATALYREPYVLAFRKGHDLEKTKRIELSKIGKTPFGVFSFGTFSRDTTDSYLSRLKFSPNICLESESLESLLSVVSTTDLCAMLPKHAVTRRPDISFHELQNPRPTRTVALLSLSRRNASPAQREFVKILKQHAGKQSA